MGVILRGCNPTVTFIDIGLIVIFLKPFFSNPKFKQRNKGVAIIILDPLGEGNPNPYHNPCLTLRGSSDFYLHH